MKKMQCVAVDALGQLIKSANPNPMESNTRSNDKQQQKNY
jgi:hypothetical protein